MKGRSHHRLPISEAPDDWGDGSWTVDCVCGVNFDDGEEMVNCDECGVWVHTRCSRFVRGEKSFACDKCKSKKNRNENEETEVAQLLVELPTKTMRMDNPYPPSAPRAPFRLWTDIPIEERVHVQGVPGGDPALFQGLSSVFTSELWKCTGYVPKKFNFKYREFPCWDEKQGIETRPEEENENPVDRGADVLFSLSKEIIPYVPPADTFAGVRGLAARKSPKDMKKQDSVKVFSGGSVQNCMKREKNQLHPVGVHSGKRRKEELELSKDRNAKKKARSADKEVDRKKKGLTPSIDARILALHEDGDSRVADAHFQDLKSEWRKETIHSENFSGQLEATDKSEEHKYESLAKSPFKAFTNEAPGHNFPSDTEVKVEALAQHAAMSARLSPRTDAMVIPQAEASDVKTSRKEEDVKTADDALNHLNKSHDVGDLNGGSSSVAVDLQKSEPADGELSCTEVDVLDVQLPQGSDAVMPPNSPQTTSKVKTDLEDDPATGNELPSPQIDRKPNLAKHLPQHLGKSTGHLSENLQVETAVSSGDYKSQDGEKETDASNCSYIDATKERVVSGSGEHHWSAEESENLGRSMPLQQRSPDSRQGSKCFEEPEKLASPNSGMVAPSLRRLVLGVGKSSASSSAVLSKSSVSGSNKVKTVSSIAAKPSHLTKQRVKVNSGSDLKKENAAKDEPGDDIIGEVSKGPLKDHAKSSANSGTNTSHTSRVPNSSMSKQALHADKHNLSDTKQVLGSSSSALATQNGAALDSGEPTGLSQSQTSSLDKKPKASGSFQKGEKINQSTSQTQPKVFNQTPPMPPPATVNPSPTLSDQELALLLHQELNSSPRVPRVPRMRHAGSMTQLASPTPTSTHSKRPSSHGTKDQVLVSRKKNKEETYRVSPRSARELTDETKRTGRLSPSPDHRCQDPDVSSDRTKRNGPVKCTDAVASAKKNMLLAPNNANGPSSSMEANDKNLSSIRSSSRDTSDDDSGIVAGSAPRTLPGLIDEIMSKGKRMSYEELCKSVLPHWHNLRKHNGERYAYSSHSQAVLDCLRNRNEWAQLIDRGPKTNSSRKRRKLDADQPLVESDNEDAKGRFSKDVEGKSSDSHREDFPKGKRKARKRKRLGLQGRGIKEVRKRQKADMVTDDDLGLYSHSSEDTESIFSEDESQGARTGAIESEASSSSSDET